MSEDGRIIPPGGTIGIVGGGQLGRMAALAAAAMGYRCHIFCPDEDSPAAQVSAKATVAMANAPVSAPKTVVRRTRPRPLSKPAWVGAAL